MCLFYGFHEAVLDIQQAVHPELTTPWVGFKVLKLVHNALFGALAYTGFMIRDSSIMRSSGTVKRLGEDHLDITERIATRYSLAQSSLLEDSSISYVRCEKHVTPEPEAVCSCQELRIAEEWFQQTE